MPLFPPFRHALRAPQIWYRYHLELPNSPTLFGRPRNFFCRPKLTRMRPMQCRNRTAWAGASSPSTEEDFTLLRPADTSTLRWDLAQKRNVLHYCASFTINTTRPLLKEDYRDLTELLWKKVPALRTNLKEVDGELWLCEMRSPVVDFEVVSGPDHVTEIKNLLKFSFSDSSSGPLWRMRALPVSSEASVVKPELSEASVVKPELPHQTIFLLSFHHGIQDGGSALQVGRVMVEILEDLLDGREVDLEKQEGYVVGGEQTKPFVEEVRARMERDDPEKLGRLVDQRLGHTFVPLLTKAFGRGESRPELGIVLDGVDTSLLTGFDRTCRGKGVTFHTGMTAALNVALVEVLRKAGLAQDAYEITSRHAVNLRRYWKPEREWTYGSHVGGLLYTINTSLDCHENFWSYARQINEELRLKVQQREALEEVVVKDIVLERNFEAGVKSDGLTAVVCDYYFTAVYPSGLGDLRLKHVHLSDVYFAPILHDWEFLVLHTIAENPEGLNHTMTYCTSIISHDTAQSLLEAVKQLLKRLSS